MKDELYNYGAWALARLLIKQPADLEKLTEPWSDIAQQVLSTDGDRKAAFLAAIAERDDARELEDAVFAADPSMPFNEQVKDAVEADNQLPEVISAKELLSKTFPDPVWVIPEILPAGLALLGGKSKIGKSWLSLQFAMAVGSGGITLNQKVARGKVLAICLEDSPRRIQGRMQKMGWMPNVSVDFLFADQFRRTMGDLGDGGNEMLARMIADAGYCLVTVDTLSRSVRGDQNDVDKMTAILAPIQEVALSKDCAVVMVDHHNKLANPQSPDVVADILGSTAKGAVADTLLGLYRERGKIEATLAITGRDVEDHSLALTMDWQTGLWQYQGDAREVEISLRKQEILQALESLGKASLKDVAKTVGQPESHTHSRLQDLVAEGLVLRIEEGWRVYYVLARQEDLQP